MQCTYVFFFIFLCIFYKTQMVFCAFLSRLKNPYLYNASSSHVEVLPEDYIVDDLGQFSTITTSQTQFTEKRRYTQKKLWSNRKEDQLWRPFKIQFRPTQSTEHTELEQANADMNTWPTVPWMFLRSRSTTEYLTLSPPSQPNSATRRSWRPYFPIKSEDKMVKGILSRKVDFIPKIDDSSTTIMTRKLIRVDSQLINLPATRNIYTDHPGTFLRVIFNDNKVSTKGDNTSALSEETKPIISTQSTPQRTSLVTKSTKTRSRTSRVRLMKTKKKVKNKSVTKSQSALRKSMKYKNFLMPVIENNDTAEHNTTQNHTIESVTKENTNTTTNRPIESTRHHLRTTRARSVLCYECGLHERGLSVSDTCYRVFHDKDKKFQYYRVRLERKCGWNNYLRGCFVRFLDFTYQYTERGCRTFPPIKGKSYASKRLRRLEFVLKGVSNGCVKSPSASLTPFSRAISLYTYYHVCVCTRKYCNSANSKYTSQKCSGLLVFLYILLNQL